MAYPDYISAIERAVIDRVIRAGLSKGYQISVHDGEDWSLVRSRDYQAITAEIAATDMTWLKFRDAGDTPVGSVTFVHGNDGDVISDCTDTPILELCA